MSIANNSFISEDAKLINSSLGDYCKIYDAELRNSKIGSKVTIGDSSIVLETRLESNIFINRRNYIFNSDIGRFTYTGLGAVIFSSKIGRFCSLSWNISIGGNEHPYDNVTSSTLSRFHQLDYGSNNANSERQLKSTISRLKPCEIENDVLISSNVVILRNIKIGNGAVIGAGAVVTKDVNSYTIVAGVPAKPIRKRFPGHIIEALEEIQWWDWPVEVIRKNIALIYSTKVDDEVIKEMREISKTLK